MCSGAARPFCGYPPETEQELEVATSIVAKADLEAAEVQRTVAEKQMQEACSAQVDNLVASNAQLRIPVDTWATSQVEAQTTTVKQDLASKARKLEERIKEFEQDAQVIKVVALLQQEVSNADSQVSTLKQSLSLGVQQKTAAAVDERIASIHQVLDKQRERAIAALSRGWLHRPLRPREI